MTASKKSGKKEKAPETKKSGKKEKAPETKVSETKASMNNADKKRCREALDVLEDRELMCDEWKTSTWRTFHDSYTAKLNGLKPCYHKDSGEEEKKYLIGLAKSPQKSQAIFPPMVKVAFKFLEDPKSINMRDVVPKLRKAVDES